MAATPLPGTPAGFWRRSEAWCLDWLLLAPVLWLVVGSRLAAAAAQFAALRGQLEDWMYAQSMPADSAIDLWLQLSGSVLTDSALQASVAQATRAICADIAWALAIAAVVASVYFIGFEASRWQATPGKRAFGLRVLAMDGSSLSLARAAGRHFAGSLSWLTLNIGHALALFRRDGRALHDLIAGTVVIRRGA